MDAEVSREQIAAFRQQHIGRLLAQASRAYSDTAYQKLHARGYDGLSMAHTTLLANLDTEGTSINMLAKRAGVSKQAMGQLVVDLEAKGYIQREADPTDRRATLISFTESGWRFLTDAYHIKQEIEAEYSAIIGAEGLAALCTALTQLLQK